MKQLHSRGWACWACGALLANACATTGAQEPAPSSREADAETVRLRFAWPSGLALQVAHSVAKERTGPQGPQRERSAMRYVLRAEPHPEGLLIRYEDMRLDEGGDQAAMAQLQQVAARLQPQLVVDPQGQFVRLEGVAALRQATLELAQQLLQDQPPEAQRVSAQMMAKMTSDEVLTARAREEWDLLVGMWAGLDLTRGEALRGTSSAPMPLVTGKTIDLEVERSFQGYAPCSEAAGAPRCARLVFTSRPDPEQTKAVLASIFGPLLEAAAKPGAAPPPLLIRDFDTRNEVELLAEPDSLRPHRLVRSRATRLTMEQQGVAQQAEEKEVKTYVFGYTPATP